MPSESASQARKRKRQGKGEKGQDQDAHQSKRVKSEEKNPVVNPKSYVNNSQPILENGKTAIRRGERVMSLEDWEEVRRHRAAKRQRKREEKKGKIAKMLLEGQKPAGDNKEKRKNRKQSKQKSSGSEGSKAKVGVNGITNGTNNHERNRASRLSAKRTKILQQFADLGVGPKYGTYISDELQQLVERAEKWVERAGGRENLATDEEMLKMIDSYSVKKQWRISDSVGGRLIDHDPVFSLDEEYLFMATPKGVNVYATATSLLVRTLAAGNVSCYALSKSKPNRLYVGTLNGQLHDFNWVTGKLKRTFGSPKSSPYRLMTVVKLPGTNFDTLFAIETVPSKRQTATTKDSHAKSTSAKDRLTIRRSPWDDSKEARQVLKYGYGPLNHLKVVDNGRAVFVAGEMIMLVGSINHWNEAHAKSFFSLEDVNSRYRWSQLNPTLAITTMDPHFRPIPQGEGEVEGESRGPKRSYDLAVGNTKGELLVYQNIVEKLEKSSEEGEHKPQPRVLHWHREAPSAVKWSLDGNYLISGGKETVLCLWQLETGKRQEFPHLTAAITGLTVSPKGVSYGIHLSDNSIIVLSTTELQPRTHVAGLQSLSVSTSGLNKHGLSEEAMDLYNTTPLAINPRVPTELLLAVPIVQKVIEGNKAIPSAPFLQTYDMSASRHISRQALTRNLVTEISIDPDFNKIDIPNVAFLRISNDGRWLATIEEWMPPRHSLDHLAYESEEVEVERRKRQETYLKIWSWDEKKSTWSLNTRVDAPHQSETDETANRIFDLVAHPTQPAFATIGEDSVVRIWLPRTVKREISWSANARIEIEKNAASTDEGTEFPVPAIPITGRLAYSNDGSVLAVSQQDNRKNQTNVIHLLDPETGKTKSAESSLTAGYLLAMGFLSRYLILVSKDLRVWDVVTSTLVFSKLVRHPQYLTLQQRLAITHLAVSAKSETFALAGNGVCEESPESGVVLFDPTSAVPIASFPLGNGAISALAPLESGGYVVLNSKAEVRTITNKTVGITATDSILVAQLPEIVEEGDEMEDEDEEEEDTTAGASIIVGDDGEIDLTQDKRVIQSDQLAKVFDAGSSGYGLPTVKDMFDSVAGLFARKSK